MSVKAATAPCITHRATFRTVCAIHPAQEKIAILLVDHACRFMTGANRLHRLGQPEPPELQLRHLQLEPRIRDRAYGAELPLAKIRDHFVNKNLRQVAANAVNDS